VEDKITGCNANIYKFRLTSHLHFVMYRFDKSDPLWEPNM
jgi:hypothetical protein